MNNEFESRWACAGRWFGDDGNGVGKRFQNNLRRIFG